MNRTPWSGELTLDVPAMDRSHRILFADLCGLAALPDRKFRARFDAMIADIERDFYSEDEWMERIDYPGTRAHREQHARALSVLHHAHSRVMAGDIEFGRIVVASLPAWIAEHILTADLPLAFAIRRADRF